MRTHTHRTAASLCALAALALTLGTPSSLGAPGARDATADVLAGRDVTLTGDTATALPSGTTRYDGAFRGRGTFTVARAILDQGSTAVGGGAVPRLDPGAPELRVTTALTGDSPGTGPRSAAGPGAPGSRATSTAADRFGWWPYVLALGLLGALVVPATVRTRGRRRRRGGRHAARE